MASIHKSQKTNFKPHPQQRKEGSGEGRAMFPWKRKYAWLLLAVDQLYINKAGSADALLEDRKWEESYGITRDWLWQQIWILFPGLTAHLTNEHRRLGIKTRWSQNIHNRIYKMYYNGTSARGTAHDPTTRASVSREHWRANYEYKPFEASILRAVNTNTPTLKHVWESYIK